MKKKLLAITLCLAMTVSAMAGCGSYSKVEGFAFLPITCFAMALTTFISQNLGAKEYQRAKKGAVFYSFFFYIYHSFH